MDETLALLDKAIDIIEVADNRAMAADGPVGHVRDEMSDKEWRDLYVALTKARALAAALASPSLDAERLIAEAYANGYRDGLDNEVDDWNISTDALAEAGRVYARALLAKGETA